MNRQIILKSRPAGIPSSDNFEMVNVVEPTMEEGELKVKAKYISVDPYLRGMMNESKSKSSSFEIGKPLVSGMIAEVMESRHPDFKPGDAVLGYLRWQELQSVKAANITKLKKDIFPLSYYLGILGMTGMTAYFGLLHIGKPKKDETVVVSGSAGAVGMVAGQLAKLKGCYVVGITGSDEKGAYLKEKLHFNAVINYRTSPDLSQAVAEACPKGVDVYYDNVGGEISDAVLRHINLFARIVICGQISLYNSTEKAVGPRLEPILLSKAALMQGFSSSNYIDQFPQGIEEMSQWIREGKMVFEETILKGFEHLPDALIGLFQGMNTGKQLVEV